MGLKVLGGRRDVGSDPYMLKAFRLAIRMTGVDHFYVGRKHGFGCKKAGKIGRNSYSVMDDHLPIIWEKGDHDGGLTATPTPYLA